MTRLAAAFARAAFDVAYIALLLILAASMTAVPVLIWRAVQGALP